MASLLQKLRTPTQNVIGHVKRQDNKHASNAVVLKQRIQLRRYGFQENYCVRHKIEA